MACISDRFLGDVQVVVDIFGKTGLLRTDVVHVGYGPGFREVETAEQGELEELFRSGKERGVEGGGPARSRRT